MIHAIVPILKGVVVNVLWEFVRGYLVTAIKDAEKMPELKGAAKRGKALERFKELHTQYEGREPGADIMRKAAERLPIVHDELEAAQTL